MIWTRALLAEGETAHKSKEKLQQALAFVFLTEVRCSSAEESCPLSYAHPTDQVPFLGLWFAPGNEKLPSVSDVICYIIMGCCCCL